MSVALFLLGLALSAAIVVHDLRFREVPHVKRLAPELHLVAAMIAGAGAGLAWGSVWGLVAFVAQAVAGMAVSTKLRQS